MSTPGWSVLESETLCDSPYLRVYREKIATPTRPDGVEWMVARRREAAVVAPQKKDGSFILIRQERVAVQRETWEFPAGQVDGDVNENTIAETALRELGEEAGVETLEGLESLGLFYSSVGFTDERAHLFLAKNVTERPEGLDQDEHEAILEVRSFTPAELREMIASGVIVDANTLALFARMIAQGLL